MPDKVRRHSAEDELVVHQEHQSILAPFGVNEHVGRNSMHVAAIAMLCHASTSLLLGARRRHLAEMI